MKQLLPGLSHDRIIDDKATKLRGKIDLYNEINAKNLK